MATTPGKDIQNLIAGLKNAPAKKAPRPRARQEPDKRSLFAAIAIIVLGFGYVAYSSFFSDAPQGGPPEDEPEPHPEERRLNQSVVGDFSAGGSGTLGGSSVGAYFVSLRPGNFLAEYFANGQMPEFVPVSKVEEPPAGKSITIYCLLHSRLDDYTESIWKNSGMLRDETYILSPYLRKVTISDRESLRNLIDWHVESVAFKLPDPPKSE
jgi:hypothetical protein